MADPAEIYASEFAVSLLLPETDFMSAKESGLDDLGLGKRFQVPPTLARWRALQLDLPETAPLQVARLVLSTAV